MKTRLCMLVLLLPWLLHAQLRTDIGINFSPLIMSNLDVRGEWHLTRSFSVQAGTGFRYQQWNDMAEPRTGVLGDYVQPRNFGLFLSVGGRFHNAMDNEWEYPFLGFDLVGVYYNEQIQVINARGELELQDVSNFTVGISAVLGFVLRINDRFTTDLGIQLGYAKPRDDILTYYYPGMGYGTFGRGIVGVRGGHVQPIISLKYTLVQDKRTRIRQMD